MSMKMKSTFKVWVRKRKQILLWYGLYIVDISYKNKKHLTNFTGTLQFETRQDPMIVLCVNVKRLYYTLLLTFKI